MSNTTRIPQEMYIYVIDSVTSPIEARNGNNDDCKLEYISMIDLATTSCVINHQMHDTQEVKEKG